MHAIIIDEIFPDAGRDSGSIDVLNYIEALRSLGYNLTLLTTLSNEADAVNNMGRVTQFEWVPGKEINDWLLVNAQSVKLVLVCRPGPASEWIHKIRVLIPDAILIYLTVDLHFLRMERDFLVSRNYAKLTEARRYRHTELACIRAADLTIVVSSYERDYLSSIDPNLKVHYVPLFRERFGSSVSYNQRPKRAVFIGGYKHFPNIDAALFLVEFIVPHIMCADPEIEVVLAGSNMPDSIRNLERKGVRTIGWIDNLERYFDSARVSVAPIRFGAGQKGKVLSSLCHGLPVVCSSIAAEGMFEGEPKGVLITDNPKEFAAGIVSLCNFATDWHRLSEQANQFSLERDTSRLPSVLSEMIHRAQ